MCAFDALAYDLNEDNRPSRYRLRFEPPAHDLSQADGDASSFEKVDRGCVEEHVGIFVSVLSVAWRFNYQL